MAENPGQLTRIIIEGFKSIQECDLELKPLNILIGANGAGKSNFIQFFNFIQDVFVGKLNKYDLSLLHFGPKKTPTLKVELRFQNIQPFKIDVGISREGQLSIIQENFHQEINGIDIECSIDIVGGNSDWVKNLKSHELIDTLRAPTWKVYHFHDTSKEAAVKQPHRINDNMYLRDNASNLAAFLYLLKNKYPQNYQRIVKTIQLVAPFFGDFNLRPDPHNEDNIKLEWFERNEDMPFLAKDFSDGTLRFICLTTLLLQPEELQPETILIDEPELGLHPYAIQVFASMCRSVSKSKQLIIATQSVGLVDEFTPDDIIVADKIEGKTKLHRLEAKSLESWLEDYSLGELWEKNLLGGRPAA